MSVQNAAILTDPYTKVELLASFEQVNREVAESFARVPADQFFQTSEGGWSPAENLVHLIKSVSAVSKGLALPKVVAGTMFGTTRKGSMRYADLRDRYVAAIHAGGQATGTYVPQVETPPDAEQAKREMLDKWREVAARITTGLQSWSEAQLDKYTLPHPLIGKITVREMLFFTLYHNLLHANEARAFLGEAALGI